MEAERSSTKDRTPWYGRRRVKKHVVPGEIHAALMTGRPELVYALQGSIERGEESLDLQAQAALLGLIVDLIDQANKDRDKLNDLTKALKNAWSQAKGVSSALDMAIVSLETAPINSVPASNYE